VHRRLALLGTIAGLLAGTACGPKPVKPTGERVAIFVTGDVPIKALPQVAAVVREARRSRHCLWLMIGACRADKKWAAFTDGTTQVALFNAAGVDAVLVGSDWLRFGPAGLRQAADQARCYLIAANLADSSGTPLAHSFMVRKLGPVTIGITGVYSDSTDVLLAQQGVRFNDPDFTIHKTIPLLRMRSNLVGVMIVPENRHSAIVPENRHSAIQPGAVTNDWAADFVIGAETGKGIAVLAPARWDRIARLDLELVGDKIVSFSVTEQDIAGVEPEPNVFRLAESTGQVVDSLSAVKVVESRVALGPEVLTRALLHDFLALRQVDCVLYDSLLSLDTLRPGPITQGQLVSALRDPDRWAVFDMLGRDIKAGTQDKSLKIAWRQGALKPRLLGHKSYRCAASISFLRRHPQLVVKGFELSERQFFETAAELLRKAGDKR